MKKYEIIYADPPWKYRAYASKDVKGSAESHYPTMNRQDIEALPVSDICAQNCILFLWSTLPCIKDALSVIDAWGFKYKTVAFVWIKKNKKADSLFWGMGFWTRSNAEICLLATKGHPKRKHAGIHQVIISPIEQHSKKPDETRNRIIELMGDLPRIELFARQSSLGWDVWGNEVSSDIDLSSGKEQTSCNTN